MHIPLDVAELLLHVLTCKQHSRPALDCFQESLETRSGITLGHKGLRSAVLTVAEGITSRSLPVMHEACMNTPSTQQQASAGVRPAYLHWRL